MLKTMKGKYILFLFCSLFLCEVSAQTLEQARALFTKGEYEKAKPVFKRYVKSNRPTETTTIGMVCAA